MEEACDQRQRNCVRALIAYYEGICCGNRSQQDAQNKKVALLKKSMSLERGQLKRSVFVSKSAFFEVHAKKNGPDRVQNAMDENKIHGDDEMQKKHYENLLKKTLKEFGRLKVDSSSGYERGFSIGFMPDDESELLHREFVSLRNVTKEGMSKLDFKRFRCAREILESEWTYIVSLRRLKKHFLDRVSFVSQGELKLIAGNVMSILSLSTMFFEILSLRLAHFDSETTLIGDILAVFVPLVSIYTEYCTRYGRCVQTIRRLDAENQRFHEALKRGAAASNGQDIYTYCVMPIQRISRYCLLFGNVLLATDKMHLDYQNLERAFKLIQDKVAEINRKLVISDQQNALVLLSCRLEVPTLPNQEILQPWRVLSGEYKIKYLRPSKRNIHSVHNWIYAYLYICNDIFIIAAKSIASTTGWNPQDKLRIIATQFLWNSFLNRVGTRRFGFQLLPHFLRITNPNGSWIIASDEKQMARLKECFEIQQEHYLSLHPAKRFERSELKLFVKDDLELWTAVEFCRNNSLDKPSKNGKKICNSSTWQNYLTLSKPFAKSSSANFKKNFNKICGELGKVITRKPSQ